MTKSLFVFAAIAAATVLVVAGLTVDLSSEMAQRSSWFV